MSSPAQRLNRPARAGWTGTAASLGLILVLAAMLLGVVEWRHRSLKAANESTMRERGFERATALAALAGDAATATFGQVDILHRMAETAVRAQLDGRSYSAGELHRLLMPGEGSSWPDVLLVSAIDANGRLLWSTLPSAVPGADLGSREHYRVFAGNPALEHYTGVPVMTQFSGEWAVPDVRAVRGANGELLATTVVMIRAGMLARFCGHLTLDPNDSMVLTRADNTVLMRRNMQHLGEVLPAPPEPGAVERNGTRTYERTSPLDGERRLLAMRRVAGTDLTIRAALWLPGLEAATARDNAALDRAARMAEAAILLAAMAALALAVMLRRNALQTARTAALADSQRWFEAVTEHIPDGVVVFDGVSQGEYRVVFASRHMTSILGVPPESLVGQTFDRFMDPADLAGAIARRTQLGKGGDVPVAVFTMIRADGRRVRVRVHSSAAPKPENPAELRGVSLFRDVTDEEAREAALAEARAQVAEILRLMPGAFYRAIREPGAPHYAPTFVSPGIESLLGLSAERAMQPGLISVVTGIDMTQQREAALAQAGGAQAGGAQAGGAKVVTVDAPYDWHGKRRWLRDTLREIPRSDGAREIVGFLSDATAQHETEQALRDSIDLGPGVHYRACVTEAGIEVLSVHGKAGRIAAAAEPDAPCLPEMLAAQLQAAGQAAALRAAPPQTPLALDYAVAEGTGTRWLRNTARTGAAAAGGVEVVGYITDITREKTELAHLQQVSTLLTLGEMATGMAHELNQPLASISFAAQNAGFLLEREPVPVQVLQTKLGKIEREAHRASSLIDHMRIFARSDSKPPAPVLWQDVLTGVQELMRAQLARCTLHNELPVDLPPVLGSAPAMEQMLINLIANATAAYGDVPPAARDVYVGGRVKDSSVVLRVSDHAGGIAPEALARVFEPFFTTKEVGKGTGLGLALVFGAVTGLGGSITAGNEDGGAVFEIHLPAAAASAEAEAA